MSPLSRSPLPLKRVTSFMDGHLYREERAFEPGHLPIYEAPSNLRRVISLLVKSPCRICLLPADWLGGDQPCRHRYKMSKSPIKRKLD